VYARATLLEIDTVRISLADAVALFEREVLPALRRQPGYQGILVLSTEEGKGVLLTLWDSATAAEHETEFYEAEIVKYLTLFASSPGREAYRVELVDGVAFTSTG
jgi:heme-degrading monooxygenase HmoA